MLNRIGRVERRAAKRARKRERRAADPQTAPAQRPKPPPLRPRTETQRRYIEALEAFQMTVAIGPAGTGKTFLAATWAARQVASGAADRIIVSRPMVSSDAAESLGFLPGDINAKFGPWTRPITEAIELQVGRQTVEAWLRIGKIEYAPFQFLRGATFGEGTIVLLDEAQNCRIDQLKLFVTRIGEAQIVISGDIEQTDIDGASGLSALVDIIERFRIPAAICRFSAADVVRSDICRMFVEAFRAV
jgi:phosphate starvation-inducible PhoH-like protein